MFPIPLNIKRMPIDGTQNARLNYQLTVWPLLQGRTVASPLHSKSKYHTRWNSLPSKPHPLISEFDDHLCRLRASEAASLSPSLTGNRLNGIQDLHDCVNKLLQLSFTQQALAQEQHKTWFDELLHESLRLLDLCGIAKDASLQTKECTHQLQSIMRRRRGRWNGAYKGDWKILDLQEGGQKPMKHGCVSRLGCGCGYGCRTRQFLKKVGMGAAGLGN